MNAPSWAKTLDHHLQGADHTPPHHGHRLGRGFPDRLLRHARHPEALVQVAGVDDEVRDGRPDRRRCDPLRHGHRGAERTLGRNRRQHPPERHSDRRGHQQDRPRRPKRSKRWSTNGRPKSPGRRSSPRRPRRISTSKGCSGPSSRCCPKARRSTPRIRSRTRRCASSPRRSSARRSSNSTTRRSPTAAKSRSKVTTREPTIDRIAATIYVARDSQKGILIGHKGEKLKRVGQTAREDMEQFLGKKQFFLQLFVKVSDDWRNNERQLRRFDTNRIINRTESLFKEQNQSACGNSSPESYWELPCCAARKAHAQYNREYFSGSDVRA